jgi:hypothetical protein
VGGFDHLLAALERPGVGLAGATAGMQSPRTWTPWLIRGTGLPAHKLAWLQLHTVRQALRVQMLTHGQPQPYIRSNAIALTADTLKRLRWPDTVTKTDAVLLESGRRGLTARVQRLGLRPVVVRRDGSLLEAAEWAATGIGGADEELLVADNRAQPATASARA